MSLVGVTRREGLSGLAGWREKGVERVWRDPSDAEGRIVAG